MLVGCADACTPPRCRFCPFSLSCVGPTCLHDTDQTACTCKCTGTPTVGCIGAIQCTGFVTSALCVDGIGSSAETEQCQLLSTTDLKEFKMCIGPLCDNLGDDCVSNPDSCCTNCGLECSTETDTCCSPLSGSSCTKPSDCCNSQTNPPTQACGTFDKCCVLDEKPCVPGDLCCTTGHTCDPVRCEPARSPPRLSCADASSDATWARSLLQQHMHCVDSVPAVPPQGHKVHPELGLLRDSGRTSGLREAVRAPGPSFARLPLVASARQSSSAATELLTSARPLLPFRRPNDAIGGLCLPDKCADLLAGGPPSTDEDLVHWISCGGLWPGSTPWHT